MKKILIPVDGSIHSTDAMNYVVTVSPVLQETIFSLFHVQPILSDYIVEEARKNPKAMEKLKQLYEDNEAGAKELLDRHKDHLIRSGVPGERIEAQTRRRKEGTSKDIIQQALSGAADGILIARRGLSKIQDTLIGSTTRSIIDHNANIPVWVVDGEISSRNILVSVDGSTSSKKALDYVLDLITKNPDVELTLFHVQPSLKDYCEIDFTEAQEANENQEDVAKIVEQANRQCIENFMQYARQKISEKGIDEDKLNFKTQSVRMNIGKAVIDEFRQGDYGTVVAGKRGIGNKFFMGSVSNYLITHLENGALWIVP